MRRRIAKTIVLLAMLAGGKALAADSVFAVVTLKKGVASALAHNHLVVAPNAAFVVTRAAGADASDPLAGVTLAFETAVERLVVDDPALAEQWYPDFKSLGVLSEPFTASSEGDRQKIFASMIDAGQMAAKAFPTVKAKIANFERRPVVVGDVAFNYVAAAELTVHGKTVTKTVNVAAADTGGGLKVFSPFRFTEFGIEPYSAFLGAVQVQDEFFVYVSTSVK